MGKLTAEIERALEVGIGCFNVESMAELERLSTIAARRKQIASIAIRVNPDIDAGTHPYISTGLKHNKFGVDIEEAMLMYQQAYQLPAIRIIGIACHIGSQLTELSPFLTALDKLQHLIRALRHQGIVLQQIDLGGGLGVNYHAENPPTPAAYCAAIVEQLQDHTMHVIIEPGRSIVAHAGILVMRVEYLKRTAHKHFAIVDAGMNDFVRPALYQAKTQLLPVITHTDRLPELYDVVGPVCETGDFLARDHELSVKAGDLLALLHAGAYGFSMSSNYNSRPRAAEVMVWGDRSHLIRAREHMEALYHHEYLMR